jgi:hypothetical protein
MTPFSVATYLYPVTVAVLVLVPNTSWQVPFTSARTKAHDIYRIALLALWLVCKAWQIVLTPILAVAYYIICETDDCMTLIGPDINGRKP